MKVKEILDWLNALAPFETAEGFDNVGLLMGNREAEVHSVLFGMDVTRALAQEALDLGCELIISHHPFIFHALKRIDYSCPQGGTLCRLAEKQVSVIGAHTNWDKAPGGVGDSLAQALQLSDVIAADDYVRTGMLLSPMTVSELGQHIRSTLRIEPRCYPGQDQQITRVAVAGGAYGEGYMAALSSGAQAYVTGEIAHHQILDASERGLTVFDAGHYATELPGVAALYERFTADAKENGWAVQTYLHTQPPYAGAILAL